MTRSLILICFVYLLPASPAAGVKAQFIQPPKSIWFNSCETTLCRFAYSQAILWPTSLGGHLYLYIREGEIGNLSSIYTLKKYKKTFTLPPVWDRDSLSWNYGVHPAMGCVSYLSYRNRKAHWAEALAGSAVNSVIYEYLIAGGTQRPSINDMIVTPVLGSLIGEGIYQLKKVALRDKHLSILEKIFISVTDPFEVLYFGFSYKKIARADYR